MISSGSGFENDVVFGVDLAKADEGLDDGLDDGDGENSSYLLILGVTISFEEYKDDLAGLESRCTDGKVEYSEDLAGLTSRLSPLKLEYKDDLAGLLSR